MPRQYLPSKLWCCGRAFREAARSSANGFSRQAMCLNTCAATAIIPWGHYAANMAHDSVRYALGQLTPEDITGMRHLYYQRTYVRLAAGLGFALPTGRHCLSAGTIENLRQAVVEALDGPSGLDYTATLWGWNYGFDYAPSGYRLHASHQQVHQQFALIPRRVTVTGDVAVKSCPAFCLWRYDCGFYSTVQ